MEAALYLIEILHQTTTRAAYVRLGCLLYLIEILHQTTTGNYSLTRSHSCILSKFYIKPQLKPEDEVIRSVVSYRNSTSNHNNSGHCAIANKLYLIEILHQTTTCGSARVHTSGCILSKFYIKPQQRVRHRIGHSCCILSKFYIKPQQRVRHRIGHSCCILSKFYIKPQHFSVSNSVNYVVSYRNSTSNHNNNFNGDQYSMVVSYRNSTSNHNPDVEASSSDLLYLIEILHQTTTSALRSLS